MFLQRSIEEYYGENVLHMSAVAEDPGIVKVDRAERYNF